MRILYLTIAVFLGIAFDWLMYSRLIGIINPQYISNTGYRSFSYPRIYATLIAIVIIFLSAKNGNADVALFFFGCALFLVSNFYAVYRFLRGDEIGE